MIIPGTDMVYEVLQFHIHTGCENKLNGVGCAADLHVVHKAKSDVKSSASLPDLAVLDLMIRGVNEYNPSMDSLITSWVEVSCPNQDCFSVAPSIKRRPFSPYNLIPVETSFYNFHGSLTTPPCWEVVNWNVSEKPILVSFRQILGLINLIDRYKGFRDQNNNCVADQTAGDVAGLTSRNIHPTNGRKVVKNCKPYKVSKNMPAVKKAGKAKIGAQT